jgi:hypothetical protein
MKLAERGLCMMIGSGLVPLFVFGLGGCKVGPNYAEPRAPVADQWTASVDPKLERDKEVATRWWEVLNDPILNNLVKRPTARILIAGRGSSRP